MTRRSRWLLLLALVPVLPVAALGAALAILDPDDFKGELSAAVQRATGRELALRGPLRVRWALSPTVEVSDVTLANLPGGTRPDMARAERIEARLSLFALLHRRLEVEQLTLIGPNILFELVDGRPNWVLGHEAAASVGTGAEGADRRDATPRGADGAEAPAPSPGGDDVGGGRGGTASSAETVPPATVSGASPVSPVALDIQRARVRNGMITLRLPGRTHVVGIRALDWRHLAAGAPLDLKAVLVYSDYEAFALEAEATPTGAVRDPWDTRWRVTAFDAALSAAGRMSLAGQYDLQVEGDIPALEKLNALLPAMALPALRGVALQTHLRSGRNTGDLPVVGKTALRITGGTPLASLPALVLDNTSLTLAEAGSEAQATGSLRYDGQPARFEARFGVPERLEALAEAKGTTPVTLSLRATEQEGGGKNGTAPEGSLSLRGTLALDRGRFAGLDAATSLRTEALRRWGSMLPAAVRGTLPSLNALSLDGQLVLPAALDAARLRGMVLRSAEVDAKGEVSLRLGAVPGVEARIDGDKLDLDRLLDRAVPARQASGPAEGGAPAGRSAGTQAGGSVISDARLPWDRLRGTALDLRAGFSTTRLAGRDWQDASAVLRLQKGRLEIDPFRLRLPGGIATLRLEANAGAREVPVTLDLDAPAVPLAVIGHYAGLPGSFEGAMRLQTVLRARGGSLQALAGSLDGTVEATMAGGGMSNAALVQIAAPALKALGITVPTDGRTAIGCLGVAGSFDRGVGRFPLIALNSTHLQLEGAGEVDLRREFLSLGLRPLVPLAGAKVAAPVVVEGPFRDIEGKLDAGGLDKLGLLFGAIFGGDRARSCAEIGLAR